MRRKVAAPYPSANPTLISRLILKVLFSMIVTWGFASESPGNTIKKTKGDSVLIDLDSESSASVGDTFFAVDSDGKKKAIIEITKTKGTKAVGKIKKGKAEVDMSLQVRTGVGGGGGSTEQADPTTKRRAERIKTLKEKKRVDGGNLSLGVLGGFGYNAMDLKATSQTTSVTYSISGYGYGIGGVADYYLSRWLSFRGLLGVERFSASGSPTNGTPCNNFTSRDCRAEINFIIGDLWARYSFDVGPGRMWLGGALGLWMPASSTTTSLDSSSITTMAILGVGGGYDYEMSDDVYLPLQFEYRIFPSSADVKTTDISIRLGALFRM